MEDNTDIAGAHLLSLLPEVAIEVQRMEDQIKGQVMSKIAEKALTPEMAYNAWMEVSAVNRLGRRLNARGKLAEGAGKRLVAKGEL